MAVTRQMVENALEMTLDDYVSDEENIPRDELKDVRERFIQLVDTTLMKECEDEDDDDDDDDDESEVEEDKDEE